MKRIVLSIVALCLFCGVSDAGGKCHKHKKHHVKKPAAVKPAPAKGCPGGVCPVPKK